MFLLQARNPEWMSKPIIDTIWREIDAFTDAALEVPEDVLQTADESFMIEFLSRNTLTVLNEKLLYAIAIRYSILNYFSAWVQKCDGKPGKCHHLYCTTSFLDGLDLCKRGRDRMNRWQTFWKMSARFCVIPWWVKKSCWWASKGMICLVDLHQ